MSTTHRHSPGKSILVICCSESCLEQMLLVALHHFGPSLAPTRNRYAVFWQDGTTVQLTLRADLESAARSAKYDTIHTCGCVYLPERTMHILRARLIDPAGWPGYFSKFA